MPPTLITDIIEPSVFNPYVVQRTAQLSALYRSGIISTDPAFDALAASGGRTLNMPFWNDLAGVDEILSDLLPLTPDAITAGQDLAVLLMRGKAWGVNGLAKALSGDDPMRAIGDLVAEFWARRMQDVLVHILEGIFGAATMAVLVHDISALAAGLCEIKAETFLDATQKMGDAKEKLTAIMMHSATESSLAKQDLISTVPDSEGKPTIKTFMSHEVIVDDGCPTDGAGVYTSYIFGRGAIAYGNGAPPVPTETGRDILGGVDLLINRKHFILHPRGVAWQGAVPLVGPSPTNAELAVALQWARVYDTKNVRIVAFKHKLS